MAPETRATKILVKEVLMDKEFLATMQKTICDALDSRFQEQIVRLDTQDGTILELQNKIENVKTDLKNTQKKLKTCEEKNEKLEHLLNTQEQYSRRNCIRVFGVPERERESTDQLVCDIAKNHMGVNLKPEQIDRSHRVRRRVEPAGGLPRRPRAIIVKLTSYRVRQQLMLNKKKLKENKTGFSIYEDLTATNRSLLWDAQKACNEPDSKIKSAWTMDGRVVVAIKASNNKTINKLIHSKDDLEKL